jgi:hypothetical protein
MRIRTIHRLVRLEREARPYIQRMQSYKRERQWRLHAAVCHAAVLAFMVRYGRPRIEEPLWRACERCEDSDAWKECRERFPTALGSRRRFIPYDASNYRKIAEPVRYAIDWFFPGANEKDKLNRVFKSAPPWFVWFTFADWSATKLGLRVPDLSSVARFERSHDPVDPSDWFNVPEGKFERRLWENGVEQAPHVYSNSEAHQDHPTSRELRRANRHMGDRSNRQDDIWPQRLLIEGIELTEEEQRELAWANFSPDALCTILKRKYPDITFE